MVCHTRLPYQASIRPHGHNLPRNEFPAGLEGAFRGIFNTAAAWNFHADNGYAGDIVVSDDLFKFFTVACGIQPRTAYQDDPAFDKIFVEVCVGVSGAVCRDQEFRAVEIRCICRNKFDLYRPLLELGL